MIRIVLVEDEYSQAESVSGWLVERWPSAQVDVISTESDFRRNLPDLSASSPDIFIIDVMLRWEDPRPDPDPRPAEVTDPQGAGFRCVKLLQNTLSKDVPVVLYSVLERPDVSADISSLPSSVRFLEKRSDKDRFLQLVGSLIATRRPIARHSTLTRDVFICHAREDRNSVVNPLVDAFEAAGITVWHDRAEIRWGDSIVAKIEEGLRISRYVIAVLSRHSVNKPWPRQELNSALSGEISAGVVKVLPLIVGDAVERTEILRQISLQQDKLYEVWIGSPDPIVKRLKERLA